MATCTARPAGGAVARLGRCCARRRGLAWLRRPRDGPDRSGSSLAYASERPVGTGARHPAAPLACGPPRCGRRARRASASGAAGGSRPAGDEPVEPGVETRRVPRRTVGLRRRVWWLRPCCGRRTALPRRDVAGVGAVWRAGPVATAAARHRGPVEPPSLPDRRGTRRRCHRRARRPRAGSPARSVKLTYGSLRRYVASVLGTRRLRRRRPPRRCAQSAISVSPSPRFIKRTPLVCRPALRT